MLEYDRINISEGIDINKCKETSRECSLCKFYYLEIKKSIKKHFIHLKKLFC